MTAELLAAASGSCLTSEQRALLPTSLAILKNEHGFSRVYYWGKLQGLSGDYLIAQGLGDTLGDKKEAALKAGGELTVAEFFESLKTVPKKSFRLGPDGVSWALLPAVTDEVKAQVGEWQESMRNKGRVFTPLTGDPASKYEFTTKTGPPGETGEAAEEPKELQEDIRLAHMVEEIDSGCSVVPVGSFILNSAQTVVANPYYRGLSLSQGLKLDSYLHLRKPVVLPSQPVSERALLDKSTQFLDPVSFDVPKGSWSLKHDPPNNLLVLRSLLFPGYVHFNAVGSAVYGSVYHGTGARNYDLPFML
eukprot:CAMPEP_0181338604 /NCGR_PEP_ID=MMETSP1101-20121128/28728_1 /TAXON_ID=46948 /ORGANISM="Rhodomonas abbreviata, Strain Caron Lab Isolate" /LENGTH=304 /DNA_ID=CAMNT_0023449351 /DNA_START=253 /DNA_END=1167 /DNA_ORIENTATION=-